MVQNTVMHVVKLCNLVCLCILCNGVTDVWNFEVLNLFSKKVIFRILPAEGPNF